MNSRKRPEKPVFFIDRALGRKLVAEALRAAGASVQIHDDHFEPDCPDTKWLAEVGKRGWAVLTRDKHIRLRFIERQALIEARVRVFVLTSGNMTGGAMAEVFLRALPRMNRLITSSPGPLIALVRRDGRVDPLDLSEDP